MFKEYADLLVMLLLIVIVVAGAVLAKHRERQDVPSRVE